MKAKSFIAICAMLGSLAALAAVESARIRVDTRVADIDGRIANGVEAIGEPDGSSISVWNTGSLNYDSTREYPDGWYKRNADSIWTQDEDVDPEKGSDVLVMNDCDVLGGHLTESLVLSNDQIHVVRHNVIVPEGKTLEIEPDTDVRFTEESRIVVSDGATLRVKGANIIDGFNSDSRDWFGGIDESCYANLMMLDGAEPIAPDRTYTSGEIYGSLPVFDRYEEGWWFRGWKTSLEGTESVDAADIVDMALTALYCNWELIYLNPSTTLVEIPAYSVGTNITVDVSSNDEWAWEKDADWFTVSDNGTTSNGTLTITCEVNASETPRSGVIKISRANGRLAREISISQLGMEHVATPVISTGSGDTTFADYMDTIWISCRTQGSTIYYTTDGSEPGPDNGAALVTYDYEGGVIGVFNVYGSTVIKAVATRFDMLPSVISELSVVRADTLATAMDIPEMFVTTAGDKLWEVTTDDASDGVSCVRSGTMTTTTRRQYSRLEMVVEGSGTLTFKWKVDCERDLTGSCNWDYLAFISDGAVQKKIDGASDWETVKVTVTGDNYHILTWLYTKNAASVDIFPGRDCAWVDQVTWTPAVYAGDGDNLHEVVVDSILLNSLGLVGASDAEIAASATADADNDGFTNEEEIILGTDPFDASDKFLINIDSVDNENGMKVSYKENHQNKNYDLTYRLLGAKTLGSGFEDVTSYSTEERKGYKFFKVTVDIQRK